VVGVVIEKQDTGWQVVAGSVREHSSRSMFDGQIHDIPRVAQVVKEVKEDLENILAETLGPVAVAAAGRALVTSTGRAGLKLNAGLAVSREQLVTVQSLAIEEAKKALILNEKQEQEDYLCVGYSIKNFTLDGQEITNPLDQQGHALSAEVIATFLPRMVVQSLQTVIQKAGLTVGLMTLEPIAASQAVIEENMRRLNLALVDIGAGTADIAISRNGSFSGYAMVPTAGDEITEEIENLLLVDFATAETLKRQLSSSTEVEFTDILGNHQTRSTEEIMKDIFAAVKDLARKISDKILELNGKAPQAVICVGGGSLTPGLPPLLGDELGIGKRRVGVRGREVVSKIAGELPGVAGPQAITPLGIALIALEGGSGAFRYLEVNGCPVEVFEHRAMKVADAILAAGFDLKKVFGQPGPGMAVELNGELKIIPGQPGKAGKITVNGQPAQVNDPLEPGDRVQVELGEEGKPAALTVGELIKQPPLPRKIYINDTEQILHPALLVNRQPAGSDRPLTDGDVISYQWPATVREVLAETGFPAGAAEELLLNGMPAAIDAPVHPNDRLELRPRQKTIAIVVNGEPCRLECPSNGTILADVLAQGNLPERIPGKTFKTLVNGAEATFITPIKEGDRVTLTWD